MLNLEKKYLSRHKEFLVTFAVVIICLVLSALFPSENNIQHLIKQIFFLFVIPVLYIKFVLKKSISDFGLNLQNKKTGIFWGTLMLIISLLIAFLFIKFTPFGKQYSILPQVVNNFWLFLIYMLIFVNFLLFLQEYFFKGFLLFSLEKNMAWKAIVIQVIIYLLSIMITKKGINQEMWQSIPLLIQSVTGGIIAYKSRSMIYSYISGLLFLILLNSYIIHTIKIQ